MTELAVEKSPRSIETETAVASSTATESLPCSSAFSPSWIYFSERTIAIAVVTGTGRNSFDAVRRSDVCLLVVDSSEGLTEQDVKIIGYVHEQGKPSVILMNKWDLIEKDTHTVNKFEEKLAQDSYFRVNKGCLVNLEHVDRMDGEDAIVHGDRVPLARARRKAFLDALNDYINGAG